MFPQAFATAQMLQDYCGFWDLRALIYPDYVQLGLCLPVVPSHSPPVLIWVPPKAGPEIRARGVNPESRSEGQGEWDRREKAGARALYGGLAPGTAKARAFRWSIERNRAWSLSSTPPLPHTGSGLTWGE